ncbi:MAG: iron-sulfur cluster carrier protein ApbC [Alphaproteobacteria bacterium]|jgi:ATP-binding protein involved in chromosome partitioning|nr:iron-sulfur cluster carrier protein ApbC [Alphaproteobacteria bacterium]MDP6811786.1 iron-sulfur cluster carrier protein ApbC [Alphaproteobacteria bacterium]
MARVTEEEVLQALGAVVDLDREQDVVSLGMISGLAVRDGNVAFSIEVDPARAEELEPLRQACEEAVADLPGTLSVTAMLTAETAPPPAAESPAQQTPAPGKMALPGIKSVIAVASGKGGVGKSTVAVNLAIALNRLGLRVGILDADVYGPSVPRLLGIDGQPESDGEKLEPMQNYGVSCMSIGFLVDPDQPTIWRGPMVMGALEQLLRDVRWGDLDVLVVDMPPGTGDAQLTMAQRVPVAGSIIVSTPQDIALIDARKGLNMFRRTDVPVLGIVENMSYFLCPNCGHRSEIFGHGGARETAAELGCDFLGEVPLHMTLRETSDAGTPVVASQPESEHAAAFMAIARAVIERL